jgi:hypothetical protein
MRLLTRAEAALYIFDRFALPSLVRAGRCHMVDGRRCFKRSELDAWLDEQRSVPALVAKAYAAMEDVEVQEAPRPKSDIATIRDILLSALDGEDAEDEIAKTPPAKSTRPKRKTKTTSKKK